MIFFRINKKEVSLICDVGSSSITLGLVDFAGETPLVLFSTRVPIAIQQDYKPEALQKALYTYLDQAIGNIEAGYRAGSVYELSNTKVENAHIVFSSPWYISKVALNKESKDKSVILDRKFFDGILDAEEKKFENEVLSSEKIHMLGDIHAVEREMLQVELNGYPTSEPLMKMATSISTSVLTSLVSHDFFSKIASKIENAFHTRKVYAHSFPFSAWSALKELPSHESDYVILDIAGEMTDVVLVKNKVMEKIYSVELGRNTLIRSLAKKMESSIDVALSNISLYSVNKLDVAGRSRLEDAFSAFMAIWRFKLEEAWDNKLFSALNSKKFFVTIDDDVAVPFMSTLKNLIGDERAVFQITNELIGDKIGYNKHVVHDPFIAIESMSLNALYKKHLQ